MGPAAAGDIAAAPCAGLPGRLGERLAGSFPRHERAHWILGGTLADAAPPALQALIPQSPIPAAVLVPLVMYPEGPSLLLTVRAAALRSHAGQISFPGGRIEPGDGSPLAAALREAQEEIGLAADRVRLLGYLPDHIVLTGYRVTPVVACVVPGSEPVLDPAEVSSVFELPWRALSGDAVVESTRRYAGVEVRTHDVLHAGHRIWGMTASILLELRALAETA